MSWVTFEVAFPKPECIRIMMYQGEAKVTRKLCPMWHVRGWRTGSLPNVVQPKQRIKF